MLKDPVVFFPLARCLVSEQEPFIRNSRAIAVGIALSLGLFGSSALTAAPTPTALPGAQSSQPTVGSGGVPVASAPVATTAPAATTAPTAPISFGSTGATVSSLQHRLRARGIKVPITGRFDVRTRAGVRILQRKLGLPATGAPDVALLQQIGVKVRGIASTGPATPVTLPDPTPNLAAIPVAMSLQGIPYRYGGSTPASGFDCSGFVSYVYAQIGKSVPHYTGDIWEKFPRVPMDQIAPGDLILMDGLGHVGMYLGGDQYIHSPQTGDVVKISSLSARGDSILGAVRP